MADIRLSDVKTALTNVAIAAISEWDSKKLGACVSIMDEISALRNSINALEVSSPLPDPQAILANQKIAV